MNILQLSTRDITGGAARAAFRLHQGLLEENINSQMLVQYRESNDDQVFTRDGFWPQVSSWLRVRAENLPLKLYPQREREMFSLSWVPESYIHTIRKFAPDILQLHWINGGFLMLGTLKKINRPIVWTLHDMWAFTGGCHYSGECISYQDRCGNCPKLSSQREKDLSRWVWKRKKNIYENPDITIVTPSNWLGDLAKRSSLLRDCRVQVIPNGLDLDRFKPVNKYDARAALDLPQDKRLILFGALQAAKSRKGGDLLQESISSFAKLVNPADYHIVLFGKGIQDLAYGLQIHNIGLLKEESSLNLLYSAADVFVAPSRQDNLPNTIMESMACGTPCASFNIGGIPDMIDHCQNGYLAQPFEPDDLANGLKWILEDSTRQEELGENSRDKAVKEYSQRLQAQRYINLYRELV